jgi:hypothetical protein
MFEELRPIENRVHRYRVPLTTHRPVDHRDIDLAGLADRGHYALRMNATYAKSILLGFRIY